MYQLPYSGKHLLTPPVDLPYVISGTPAVLECAAISHIYSGSPFTNNEDVIIIRNLTPVHSRSISNWM